MHCHNCNSQVNTNENFCRNCGAKINTTHQNQTSNMQSQTQYQTQSQAYYQTQEGISVSQRIANSMNRVEIDPEEELINAYIGEKANELKKDFSWCTFLFGVFYPIYRKMWGFAIIWFIINLVATVIFPGSGTITRIIAAVIFKELYVKTVRKRVNKIKEQNPEKSHEDLLLICSKKGGTSILSVILFSIFSVIMIIAVIIIIFAILIATDYENQTVSQEVELPLASNTVDGLLAASDFISLKDNTAKIQSIWEGNPALVTPTISGTWTITN